MRPAIRHLLISRATGGSGPAPTPPVTGPGRYYGTLLTTSAAPFARDGARMEFFLGKYWLLGGWNPALPAAWSSQITTNEVWSSTDLITWTLELAHVTNPPTSGAGARWRMRHTHMTFVLGGLLWVVGGDGSDPAAGGVVPSDVWNSPDGVTWTRVAANSTSSWAGSFGLYLPIPALYNNEMHILGGYDSSVSSACNRHWKSTDGITWTQLPNMPFSRDSVTNAVVLGTKLFVIGGNSGGNADPTTRCNDTWMWDGTTWTQQSSTAPWSVGEWIATSNFDNRLWVLTRKTTPDGNATGLWASDDLGVTWVDQQVYPWPQSHADAICTTTAGIALIPGVTSGFGNNVYFFKRLATDPSVTMATLAWRLWFDGAEYNPVTPSVAGRASAGNSGTKTVAVTGVPTSGAINGQPTIIFDGSTMMLQYSAGSGAADIVSNAAWTVVFTGKITTASTNNSGSPYLNASLGGSSDADFAAVDVRSDNSLHSYQFVGGVNKVAGPQTWAAGTLVHIQARYDGTTLSIRLGKTGAWATVASAQSSITGAFNIGAAYNNTAKLAFELCEYAATNVALSDATLGLVADDMHAKWGVSI